MSTVLSKEEIEQVVYVPVSVEDNPPVGCIRSDKGWLKPVRLLELIPASLDANLNGLNLINLRLDFIAWLESILMHIRKRSVHIRKGSIKRQIEEKVIELRSELTPASPKWVKASEQLKCNHTMLLRLYDTVNGIWKNESMQELRSEMAKTLSTIKILDESSALTPVPPEGVKDLVTGASANEGAGVKKDINAGQWVAVSETEVVEMQYPKPQYSDYETVCCWGFSVDATKHTFDLGTWAKTHEKRARYPVEGIQLEPWKVYEGELRYEIGNICDDGWQACPKATYEAAVGSYRRRIIFVPLSESPSGNQNDLLASGPWRLKGHSYQIADTGDYDGHYEITDGKISFFSKLDDEVTLQPIVDALNQSGAKIYLDDRHEYENSLIDGWATQLQNALKEWLSLSEESDMRPEDECAELYNKHKTILDGMPSFPWLRPLLNQGENQRASVASKEEHSDVAGNKIPVTQIREYAYGSGVSLEEAKKRHIDERKYYKEEWHPAIWEQLEHKYSEEIPVTTKPLISEKDLEDLAQDWFFKRKEAHIEKYPSIVVMLAAFGQWLLSRLSTPVPGKEVGNGPENSNTDEAA